MSSTGGAGEFRTKVLVVEDEEFTRTIHQDHPHRFAHCLRNARPVGGVGGRSP